MTQDQIDRDGEADSSPVQDELAPGRVDSHMATGEEPEADVIEQSIIEPMDDQER